MDQASEKGQIEVKHSTEMVCHTPRTAKNTHRPRADDEVGSPLVGCVANERSNAPRTHLEQQARRFYEIRPKRVCLC
jgi:hypothetical protein